MMVDEDEDDLFDSRFFSCLSSSIVIVVTVWRSFFQNVQKFKSKPSPSAVRVLGWAGLAGWRERILLFV
jgi:hypothetical protein